MKIRGFATRLGLLVLALATAVGMVVWADEPPKGVPPGGEKGVAPPQAAARGETHGGVITDSREFKFEIAFHTDRVALYLYDKDMTRLPLKGAKGFVTVEFMVEASMKVHEKWPGLGPITVPDAEVDQRRPLLSAPLVFLDPKEGESLQADLDLSRIAEGEAQVKFTLTGLPGKEEKEATIELPFRIARTARYVCERHQVEKNRPASCLKCLAEMKREWIFYGCPVHADVASDRKGDLCWKCGDKALMLMVEEDRPIPKAPDEKRPE